MTCIASWVNRFLWNKQPLHRLQEGERPCLSRAQPHTDCRCTPLQDMSSQSSQKQARDGFAVLSAQLTKIYKISELAVWQETWRNNGRTPAGLTKLSAYSSTDSKLSATGSSLPAQHSCTPRRKAPAAGPNQAHTAQGQAVPENLKNKSTCKSTH